MPARIQVNPLLVRVPGSETAAFLRSDRLTTFELTPDTFEFLAGFLAPRRVDEVLAAYGDEVAALIERLVALRILVPEGGALGERRLRVEPVASRLCAAPIWLEDQEAEGAVVVLGARSDDLTLASHPRGAAAGPPALRQASAAYPIEPSLVDGRAIGLYDPDLGRHLLRGARLLDAGDLAPLPGAAWSEFAAALGATIAGIVGVGARPFVIGGDHAVSLPVIEAVAARGPIGVLHFDAHTDAAPLRHDGELHHGNVMRHVAALPQVRHLVTCGVRGFQDIPERLGDAAYVARTPTQLRALADAELAALLRPDLPYYVTFDVDALDPTIMPATGVPEPEGLGLAEARRLLRVMIGGRAVVGADLVEVQGTHGQIQLAARAAFQVAAELIDLLAR